MPSVDRVCEELRTAGRRITPQRRAIVRVLVNEESHLTAEQVLTRVRHELPTISPATVYNTLNELSEMGLLQELDLGLGLDERRYQVTTERHDHMVCVCCGRIEDVTRRRFRRPNINQDHGFEIVDRRVIYLGYCPHCVSDPEVRLIISKTE